MKCLNKILIMTLLLSLFSGGIINKTIINAEDTNDVDIVQPCYQTLPVKKTFGVSTNMFNGGMAMAIFTVTGTYDKGTYAITNTNLSYTYYITPMSITSYSVQSVNVSYKTSGTTLYAVASITLKVVAGGKTGYVSGSSTKALS